jgi:hypothetical protein
MKNNIYQIYYSEQSRNELDPGFIALDNSGQRPDWREYWPMRRFLLEEKLNEDEWYGFFSPKFKNKTGLDAAQVHAFLNDAPRDADVVTFSPFYDQAAYFAHIFEHARSMHEGIQSAIDGSLALVAPGLNVWSTFVMSAVQTVFCNYWVAKPVFWRRWLTVCEQIFQVAEAGAGALAEDLNRPVKHDGNAAPAKVFIIERIVSLILTTQPQWRVHCFNSMKLPPLNKWLAEHFPTELVALDALKFAANSTGNREYALRFFELRNRLFETLKQINGTPQSAQD